MRVFSQPPDGSSQTTRVHRRHRRGPCGRAAPTLPSVVGWRLLVGVGSALIVSRPAGKRRRRSAVQTAFLFGGAVFANPALFSIARVGRGLGAAALVPTSLGLIGVNSLTEPARRAPIHVGSLVDELAQTNLARSSSSNHERRLVSTTRLESDVGRRRGVPPRSRPTGSPFANVRGRARRCPRNARRSSWAPRHGSCARLGGGCMVSAYLRGSSQGFAGGPCRD